MIERVRVFFRNLPSAHHRLMARYLRRRGWVAFYLEEQHRECQVGCWLRIYQDGERRKRGAIDLAVLDVRYRQ